MRPMKLMCMVQGNTASRYGDDKRTQGKKFRPHASPQKSFIVQTRVGSLLSEKISVKAESNMHMNMFIFYYKYEKIREK